MRGYGRAGLILAVLALAPACGSSVGDGKVVAKSPASVRAKRRAYDGAPPVVPHTDFGMSCIHCHNERGIEVKDIGFAPPSPHERTEGLSALSNCRQCHVFRQSNKTFKQNLFAGLRQNLRRGRRLNALAPPVRPHSEFMRENCQACHTGPAAREEIRCSHPERPRCTQCHVEQTTMGSFSR